jgi:hypothetical protein
MPPFTVDDTGYPIPTLKATGLPGGLKLTDEHDLTGTISGLVRVSTGTYVATIISSSKAGTAKQVFTVTVLP